MKNNIPKEKIHRVLEVTDIYLDMGEIQNSFVYPDTRLMQKRNPEEIISKEKKYIDMNDEIEKKVFLDFQQALKDRINKESHKKDHKVIFHGRHFRCYEIPSLTGNIVACRQMPVEFMKLEDTGMEKRVMTELSHPRLKKGGLVIVSGAPGNGKTTTCSATIERWLNMFGGLCITVEDPIEIKLHGSHGKGMCIQTEVEGQQGFAPAVRGIMRAYPTGQTGIMLIGETRDAETATEAIRSSLDGRLVITTMHAQSPLEAITRFVSFSRSALGGEAYDMLANSLKIVVGQKIAKNRLMTRILVNEVEVSGSIKAKKLSQLRTHLEIQDRKIKNNEPFSYPKM